MGYILLKFSRWAACVLPGVKSSSRRGLHTADLPEAQRAPTQAQRNHRSDWGSTHSSDRLILNGSKCLSEEQVFSQWQTIYTQKLQRSPRHWISSDATLPLRWRDTDAANARRGAWRTRCVSVHVFGFANCSSAVWQWDCQGPLAGQLLPSYLGNKLIELKSSCSLLVQSVSSWAKRETVKVLRGRTGCICCREVIAVRPPGEIWRDKAMELGCSGPHTQHLYPVIPCGCTVITSLNPNLFHPRSLAGIWPSLSPRGNIYRRLILSWSFI